MSPATPKEFLKNSGKRARANGASAPSPPRTENPLTAPPCPECGQPFSQEFLADPGCRALAIEGSALCSDECQKADDERYFEARSYQQLIRDGWTPEELAQAGKRP